MKDISLPAYEKQKCRLFALGRNAMYAACGAFGLKAGDEVLTPAFDCDGSLQPFRVLGLKLKFYRSDPFTFAADADDIRAKLSPSTRMIHVINHFGMPQPWDGILGVCKQAGVPVLEDCAYSLFSKDFGTYGDMSVFSLRKNLPMIDGGMLRVNNARYNAGPEETGAPLFYRTEAANVLTLVKNALGYYKAPEGLRNLIRKANPSVEPPPPLYSEKEKGYPEWPLRDHIGREFSCGYTRPISRLARMQLEGIPAGFYSGSSEMKRRYYGILRDSLKGIAGIRVLWPELPDGIVPFCLSMLVEDGRDRMFGILRKKYDVMAWPTLPQAVLDELDGHPDVELLGRKLLQANLPAVKVMRKDFAEYLERLAGEIRTLSKA